MAHQSAETAIGDSSDETTHNEKVTSAPVDHAPKGASEGEAPAAGRLRHVVGIHGEHSTESTPLYSLRGNDGHSQTAPPASHVAARAPESARRGGSLQSKSPASLPSQSEVQHERHRRPRHRR